MFYDLNVPWTPNDHNLPRTLLFLDQLGYNVAALNHSLSGKLPADLSSPIPNPLPTTTPPSLRLLRRCTLTLSDPSQNHRLAALGSHYDLIAVRPTTAVALQQACQTLDNISLISLDLTVRHGYYFKHSLCRAAIARGVRFEICYSPGVLASDAAARRNLISNATQLIRATRGRGIVLSSEAKAAVGLRAPIDVVNLAVVWGLGAERAREAVEREARAVVALAEMRRTSWRGVIKVVDGGDKPTTKRKMEQPSDEKLGSGKAEPVQTDTPMSKRRAKRARLASANMTTDQGN